MLGAEDESAIQADSYIEALLAAHGRMPVTLPPRASLPAMGMRRLIRLFERGLPRFHPSFLFEERLAAQLRDAATALPARPAATADRRLLMGGAIASGVSIAGAAMYAWRRSRQRPWTA
jgi:hypothetical protein